MDPIRTRLIEIYAEMAALTSRACEARNGCFGRGERGHCCEPDVCLMMRDLAIRRWGEDPGAGDPYNSDGPCPLPPHLRPLCIIHHCEINSMGMFLKLSQADNLRYWELREAGDAIEMEMSDSTDATRASN